MPPRNNCESNLRRKRNFNVPLAKTKRLKNTFTAISGKVVGKVHATNPKGIVGGFELTVVQKKGTRGHGRMFASAQGKQQK